MHFGVFMPQGWKMELASIDGGAAKWAKAVEIATRRRAARLRLDLGLRPLPQRPPPGPRGGVRVLDDRRRDQPADQHDPTRPDGRLCQLPQPGAARQDHVDGRRHLRRTSRLGHRRRLVRERVPGLRLRLPAAGRAHRPPRRHGRDRQADVERARRHVQRPLPLGVRGAVRSQTAAAAAPTDLDRRRRRAADPARRRRTRRLLQLRRRPGDVDAQARRAAITLRRGRARRLGDPHDVVAGDPPPRAARRRSPLPGIAACGAATPKRGGRATSSARPSRSARSSPPTSRPASPASWRGAPTIPTRRRSSCFARDVVPNFR